MSPMQNAFFGYPTKHRNPAVPDVVKGHAYFSFAIASHSGFYSCTKSTGQFLTKLGKIFFY